MREICCAEVVTEICAAMETTDDGLSAAARAIRSLWPLLELAARR